MQSLNCQRQSLLNLHSNSFSVGPKPLLISSGDGLWIGLLDLRENLLVSIWTIVHSTTSTIFIAAQQSYFILKLTVTLSFETSESDSSNYIPGLTDQARSDAIVATWAKFAGQKGGW